MSSYFKPKSLHSPLDLPKCCQVSVTAISSYTPHSASWNGLDGDFASINQMPGQDVKLRFQCLGWWMHSFFFIHPFFFVPLVAWTVDIVGGLVCTQEDVRWEDSWQEKQKHLSISEILSAPLADFDPTHFQHPLWSQQKQWSEHWRGKFGKVPRYGQYSHVVGFLRFVALRLGWWFQIHRLCSSLWPSRGSIEKRELEGTYWSTWFNQDLYTSQKLWTPCIVYIVYRHCWWHGGTQIWTVCWEEERWQS